MSTNGSNYKKRESLSHKGVVHGEVTFWTSKSNLSCAKFNFRTESDGLYQCFAFRKVADEMKAEIRPSSEISILAYFKDEVDKGERTLTIQTYALIGKASKKDLSYEGQLIREYGSLERMREVKFVYEKEQAELGIVKASGRFVNKKFCVRVDGRWYLAIEWLMDVLGAKTIEDLLREYNISEILEGHNRQYQDALNELIALAESDSGKQALRD